MKRNLKQTLATVLTVILILTAAPLSGFAIAESHGGTCGDNLTWSYDNSDGTLSISGVGAMNDYTSNNRPWESYIDNIKSVIIGDEITYIGQYAFYAFVNLENVVFSDSVTTVGDFVFQKCTNLETITLSDNLTAIGNFMFGNCEKLSSITIPDSVSKVGYGAFSYCVNLETIVIPNSVNLFDQQAFLDCYSLKKLYFQGTADDWVKISFGDYIANPMGYAEYTYFRDVLVADVELSGGITSLNSYAFYGCESLISITIPDSVTEIGSAFWNCTNLKKVNMSENLVTIGASSFRNCTNLQEILIPDSVTAIKIGAFDNCISLKAAYYRGSMAQWNEISIDRLNDYLISNTIHYNYREDIKNVTYPTQEDTHKTFTVTANGRQSMIQFIEPDGGTRTYDRYNKNVSITSYDIEGNVVNAMSRDLSYEVWEIYSNMSVGVEIKVRGKENGNWDSAKYSFVIEEYNPVFSMELSATSGNKGAVPATVVADEKTEKVMFKMPNGTSSTVSTFTTDENGNRIFTGKAWMNEDGLNEIAVYIRRNNVWKYTGTLEYIVE